MLVLKSLTGKMTACVFMIGALAILPAQAQTITSPKGYSVTPAKGWQVKPGFMGADTFIFAKPVAKFAPNLNVVVTATAPGDSIEKFPQQEAAMYPRMFANYHAVSGRFVSLHGRKGYESVATYTIGTPERKLRLRQDCVIVGSQAFIVTCTAPDDSFAHYAPAFDAMVRSTTFRTK